MKLLGTKTAFWLVLWINVALLIAHIAIESVTHNINWLRLGYRSSFAASYIRIEGFASILLGLAAFEMYYPSMRDMLRSKEMKFFAIIFFFQVVVWCFYY